VSFSVRTVPRRRRVVPRAVILVLRPVLRYSRWRDAYILRFVGERRGPVLQVAPAKPAEPGAGPSAAVVAPRRRKAKRRWRTRTTTPRVTILAAVAIAAIVVAGVIGVASSAVTVGKGVPPSLTEHASAGLLEVSFPSGWRDDAARDLPALGLSDELAVAPPGGSRSVVAVGRAATTDPSLLPTTVLASLADTPTPQLVTLGDATFYRYLNLAPRGQHVSESVYAVPTTAGTVLAVCQTPKADAGFASVCERIASSIRVGSQTLAPGLVPSYASTLTAVIARLDAIRASAGRQLSKASNARVQASAAAELAAAHAQAGLVLTALRPGPATAANSAVAAALRTTGAAYGALTSAARRANVHRYRTAAASVATANNALIAAFARLQDFGYRVG
jgi:hypothetical protein